MFRLMEQWCVRNQNEGIRPTGFGFTCSSDIAKILMQKNELKEQ